MLETLIESQRKPGKRRFLGVGFLSLTIHTALIAGAIITTVKAGQSDTKVRTVTPVVIEWPYEEQKPQVQIDEPITGLRKVALPPEISTDVPQIKLQVDPEQGPSGARVDSGATNSLVQTGDWYPESLVEEKPELLSAPQARYPELMTQEGIGGQVFIQAIIDTSGRAELSSVAIIRSPNRAFDAGSRNWILHAQFRPARVQGRAVRVLIQVSLDYRITGR